MKYPFQPEILDALPEELAELFRSLELVLLDEICSRLKAADELNEVTVQDIRALRSHSIDLKEIKKAIKNEAEEEQEANSQAKEKNQTEQENHIKDTVENKLKIIRGFDQKKICFDKFRNRFF